MSLKYFHRQEPGQPQRFDVRTLGALSESEPVIPYPVPAEIERSFGEVEWEAWTKKYQEQINLKRWSDALNLLFYLKILDPKRALEVSNPALKAACLEGYSNLGLVSLARYHYVFSEDSRESLSVDPERSPESISSFLEHKLRNINNFNNDENLNLVLFIAILYPEYFSEAIREKFRLNFFATYKAEGYEDQLKAAAYLRILYPSHLKELEINLEKVESWGSFSTDYCEDYACLKILACPEIPGLTTWPPKSAEPKIADNIPEQPARLVI